MGEVSKERTQQRFIVADIAIQNINAVIRKELRIRRLTPEEADASRDAVKIGGHWYLLDYGPAAKKLYELYIKPPAGRSPR